MARFTTRAVHTARLISAIIATLLMASVSAAASLRVGDRLPAAMLPGLAGKGVATGALAGKTVVLYFWTDACGCREQLIELKPYLAGLKQRPFVFHAINAGQERAKVERFVAENRIPYEVLLDEKAHMAREQFNLRVLPTVFIVDKNGVLREKLIGVVDTKKLQTLISKYL